MRGGRVHRAVVASGARFTGATIHFIDEEYDTGPILAQRVVRVYPSDTPHQVGARVLSEVRSPLLTANTSSSSDRLPSPFLTSYRSYTCWDRCCLQIQVYAAVMRKLQVNACGSILRLGCDSLTRAQSHGGHKGIGFRVCSSRQSLPAHFRSNK